MGNNMDNSYNKKENKDFTDRNIYIYINGSTKGIVIWYVNIKSIRTENRLLSVQKILLRCCS